MSENLIYLLVATIAQGLLLGFIMLTRPANHGANRRLGLYIVLVSIDMLAQFFRLKDMPAAFYYSGWVVVPSLGMHGPLVYFYTRLMTGHECDWKKERVHYLPSLLYMIILVTHNLVLHPVVRTHDDLMAIRHSAGSWIVPAYIVLATTAGLVYSVKALWLVNRYSRDLREYVSDVQRLSLYWLRVIVVLVCVFFATFSVLHINRLFLATRPGPPPFVAGSILLASMICIVFVAAFFALRQPDIFEFLPGQHALADDEPGPQQKYQKHNITDDDMRQYATMLETYMSTHKPFLDEELTLKELAVRMKIPAHHLSITLNSCLNRNFYAYINGWRVEEFKRLFRDSPDAEISILDAAYRSGFASKSTFNKVFKEISGETPRDYLNRTQTAQSA